MLYSDTYRSVLLRVQLNGLFLDYHRPSLHEPFQNISGTIEHSPPPPPPHHLPDVDCGDLEGLWPHSWYSAGSWCLFQPGLILFLHERVSFFKLLLRGCLDIWVIISSPARVPDASNCSSMAAWIPMCMLSNKPHLKLMTYFANAYPLPSSLLLYVSFFSQSSPTH